MAAEPIVPASERSRKVEAKSVHAAESHPAPEAFQRKADHRLVIDARVAGMAVAAVAVWRRLPVLLIVVLAAVNQGLGSAQELASSKLGGIAGGLGGLGLPGL